MIVAQLLTILRGRLYDDIGTDAVKFWTDFQLIDDIANQVRTRLFGIVKSLLVDSTTVSDGNALPLSAITIVKDTALYAMSPKIIQTTRFQLASQKYPIPGLTQSELEEKVDNWRGLSSGVPYCYVTDYETDKVLLVPPPNANDTAKLTNRIYPLTALSSTSTTASLGFRECYHDALIPGILSIAFDKKDEEIYRPDLMAKYETQFVDRAHEIKLDMYRRQHAAKNPPVSAFRS